MSDEQRKEDDTEVEGHLGRPGENDEPVDDDDDFDAHVMRMD
jgi:hypothetical protein